MRYGLCAFPADFYVWFYGFSLVSPNRTGHTVLIISAHKRFGR